MNRTRLASSSAQTSAAPGHAAVPVSAAIASAGWAGYAAASCCRKSRPIARVVRVDLTIKSRDGADVDLIWPQPSRTAVPRPWPRTIEAAAEAGRGRIGSQSPPARARGLRAGPRRSTPEMGVGLQRPDTRANAGGRVPGVLPGFVPGAGRESPVPCSDRSSTRGPSRVPARASRTCRSRGAPDHPRSGTGRQGRLGLRPQEGRGLRPRPHGVGGRHRQAIDERDRPGVALRPCFMLMP